MSDATFETFLVSGLLVLIAAIGYLAWSAWRWVDRERDMEKRALAGVSHEIKSNLDRMLSELGGIATGTVTSDIELLPVVHPQLDALLSRPNEADRRGLTVIRANYNELSAHKQSLRSLLLKGGDPAEAANLAVDAAIKSLATLYLWEEHKGRPPELARSTRSWDVRDWMKAHKFDAHILPGLHLRDLVVEHLRGAGMALTPRPLTHTAHEYFSKRYDRKADPNAPFWKRKAKVAPVPVVTETADAAEVEAPEPDVVAADPVPAETPPAPEPTADAAPIAAEPAPTPEVAPEVVVEPTSLEPQPDSGPEIKPPTPGSVL
ncbi:MAG: hypothetical protein AAFR51_10685 [Pseudomonadota bacterium]